MTWSMGKASSPLNRLSFSSICFALILKPLKNIPVIWRLKDWLCVPRFLAWIMAKIRLTNPTLLLFAVFSPLKDWKSTQFSTTCTFSHFIGHESHNYECNRWMNKNNDEKKAVYQKGRLRTGQEDPYKTPPSRLKKREKKKKKLREKGKLENFSPERGSNPRTLLNWRSALSYEAILELPFSQLIWIWSTISRLIKQDSLSLLSKCVHIGKVIVPMIFSHNSCVYHENRSIRQRVRVSTQDVHELTVCKTNRWQNDRNSLLYETCRAATSKKTVIKTSLVTDRNYCRKRNVFNKKQEVSFFSTLTDSPVWSSREKVQNRVNEKNYFHPPSIDSASQLTKILSSFRIQQRLRSSFRLNYNEN